MDNVTIKLYKDGTDVIVVFKNASEDLCSIIQRVLEVQTAPVMVPDLEAPPECIDEPRCDLSILECLTPAPEVKTFNDFIQRLETMICSQTVEPELKEACRKYYVSHDKIMADVISTLELNRVKGFVKNCYRLDGNLKSALDKSGASTIEEFVGNMAESELRNTAYTIGNIVVSFFEKAE